VFRDQICRIEFFGGPFDGHVQIVRLAANNLASVVALPVSREMLEMLDGRRPSDDNAAVTSEAMYQLDGGANSPYYRFIRSLAPVRQTQH
jgi:hypothetical protein